jgi:alpha/beta superfamily hydrolase
MFALSTLIATADAGLKVSQIINLGLQFIQSVIDQGWNLCLFDFVGSGISEGEYISLGYYESMDLQTIISFLLKEGNSKIHLWGRSMGAATSTIHKIQLFYICPKLNKSMP